MISNLYKYSFAFFVSWYINFPGLFNAKISLAEEKQWNCLTRNSGGRVDIENKITYKLFTYIHIYIYIYI